MIPVALPGDPLLVHGQVAIVYGESVRIIEQAPCYEPARNNGVASRGILWVTAARVICLAGVAQLPVIPALHVSGFVRKIDFSTRLSKNMATPKVINIHFLF